MKSLIYLLKNLIKNSDFVMSFYINKNSNAKFFTCGFPRSGNVSLNRKLRLNNEHEFIQQNFHSAGYGSALSKIDVKALFIIRKPVDCILSNKVAEQEISLTAIYLSYIFFLFKVTRIKKCDIVLFEDLISDSSVFQEKILKFLNLKTLRLPSNEFVSNWIKKDPVNNNNDLYISTPSKKKDEAKKMYRDKVETHFLKKIANKLYIRVINNE